MAVFKVLIVTVALFALSAAQRSPFAGLGPIGYPAVAEGLGNRVGEDADVPIEAKVDGSYINRVNRLPVDNQPFGYLNWRQYEALRKEGQTYQPNPNSFINN